MSASVTLEAAKLAQGDFEKVRFDSLPGLASHGSCAERSLTSCYWADTNPPPPRTEPASTRDRREQLLRILDTLAVTMPGDRWAVEQRVRYLEEAGRPDSALAAARACRVSGWACDVLLGFALHELGRYVSADSAYDRALAKMSAKDRCGWRNVDLLIDDDLNSQYAQFACGDSRRDAFEDRVWHYARTLYSLPGNDSRTEHYARKTMDMMLHDAPDVQADTALRPNFVMSPRVWDMYLQLGWPRGWAKSRLDVGLLRASRLGSWPWPREQRGLASIRRFSQTRVSLRPPRRRARQSIDVGFI